MSGRDPRWRELRSEIDPAAAEQHALEEIEAEMGEVQRLREESRGAEAAESARAREVQALERRRKTSAARIAVQRVEGMMGEVMREGMRSVRALFRSPGFAVVAIATLGIGIGANALVFGLIDGVLLEELPYPNPEEIVHVWEGGAMSGAEFDHIRENTTTLAQVGGYSLHAEGLNLETDGEPVRLVASAVDRTFLEITGNPLALGGGFTEASDEIGGAEEVILSHGIWTEHFGGARDVLGQTVVMDGRARTVVGVLRPDHSFPSAIDDVLIPLRVDRQAIGNYWGNYLYQQIGRLRPGATPAQAAEELRAYSGGYLMTENPIWTPQSNYRLESTISPLRGSLVGDVQSRLYLLAAVVGVVLLVVAANVGNLLLARGLARRRDYAVRAALGAGRARLIRAQIVEGLVLAAGGAVVGLALASGALSLLRPALIEILPRVGEVGLDGRVFGVTALIAGLVGVGAGAIAALRGVDSNPTPMLRTTDGAGIGRARQRLSRILVAGQVAASVVLVTGAGLLIRDLGAVRSIDPEFAVRGLVTTRVDFSPTRWATPGEAESMLSQAQSMLREDGNLENAALAWSLPFTPNQSIGATYAEGYTPDPNALPFTDRFGVSVDYFETMGIELVAGRLFDDTDVAGAMLVAIVDEAAVDSIFQGDDPIGKTIQLYGPYTPAQTVVGVVRNVRHAPITEAPRASWYMPLAQNPPSASVWAVARPRGDATQGFAALRRIATEVDPTAPLSFLGRYDALLGREQAQARFLSAVVGGFAAITLLLGALGVYGVTSFSVRQRIREFGVRVALGASAGGILNGVVMEGLKLALAGSVVGLLIALSTSTVLESFLSRVGTTDPVTFAGVLGVMVAATILAAYLPARRATRVDPAQVLRGD